MKETLTEAANKFHLSGAGNDRYSFKSGANWYKKWVLELIQEEIQTCYNISNSTNSNHRKELAKGQVGTLDLLKQQIINDGK